MRLGELYRIAVETGMRADERGSGELQRVLRRSRKAYEDLAEEERPFFDTESLENPYADTRIAHGSVDSEVRTVLVGIDMEVGEILLADRLRERGDEVDLVLAHHPEGQGLANLHEIMPMQADLWHLHGVGIGLADALIAPRAGEVRRKILPANSYRTVDAARLLDIPLLSCHTPADNCVNRFVQEFLDRERPETLEALVKSLRTIPEYGEASRRGYGPMLIEGSGSARPGKVVVDMTGGTEGPKDALDKLSSAGVDTLVGMHYSEEHRKRAAELKLNLVVAGHVSSDAIGMNLILDAVEQVEPLKILATSGMTRVKRS